MLVLAAFCVGIFLWTSRRLRFQSFKHQKSALPLGAPNDSSNVNYKHINVWISGHHGRHNSSIQLREVYPLNFKVGRMVDANLLDFESARMPETDIPDQGLDSDWVLISNGIALAASIDQIHSVSESAEQARIYIHRFRLTIPKDGDSDLQQLWMKPIYTDNVGMDVLIFARGVLYRKFNLEFTVSGDFNPSAGDLPFRKSKEEIHGPAKQLNIGAYQTHNRPPGNISISILKFGGAYVQGEIGGGAVIDTHVDWSVPLQQADGRIENLRSAAEAFRAKWGEKYLDNISQDELTNRLTPHLHEAYEASQEHQRMWDQEVSVSSELYDLAYYGYELYQTFFKPESDIRSWLDSLKNGWRVNISWSDVTAPSWIPHVPWGLMFRSPPDSAEELDPHDFLGLRYRINYTAHDVKHPKSKALGGLNETFRANCFYRGSEPSDPIASESAWQQTCFSKWPNQLFIPRDVPDLQSIEELRRLLRAPQPNPMPLMYFYCQCEAGRGKLPVLYFGNDASQTIQKKDIGINRLVDQPLVFVNACRSSAASVYRINELEQMFFDRGCRAYLGTETFVPIRLAACFANIFHHYFYREMSPGLISAGEAVFQTRQFLWGHFRNIGGLLYSYINQYELYMATEEELNELLVQ